MEIESLKGLNTPVNPELEKIAKQMNTNYSFDVIEETKDEDEGYYINQPVNPKIAEYYYDKSDMVASSVDIYAEDTILTNKIIATNDEYDLSKLNKILNKLRLQLSYQYADKKLFGAGCSKIVLFEDGTFTLVQLLQKTLRIKKIKHTDGNFYPIIQQEYPKPGGGNDYKYYKRFDIYYPPDLDNYNNKPFSGFVTWLGESQFNNYYEKPFWLQNNENIGAKISIETLDRITFNSGNNANGVFYFNQVGQHDFKSNRPPKPMGEEETKEEDLLLSAVLPSNVEILKRELKTAGYGTAFLYEKTKNPMNLNYVKISNDNYDYISNKIKDINQSVISRSQIPRERYMFNDIKESMNSQKTQAFWEIYTTKIDSNQFEPESMLENLVEFIYGIVIDINIEVPLFSVIKTEKINMIKELFNSALLTLRQALNLINPYISELDLDEIDIEDPILDMRFFNGRSLTDFGGSYPDIESLGLGGVFGSD